MNQNNKLFKYEYWENSMIFLEAQMNMINKNKHFNSLDLQYFNNLDNTYKEYIKNQKFFDTYINNLLFYGLEDIIFNYIYYIPKDRFAFRKKSFSSLCVRLINNSIGLYLFNLTKNFINEIFSDESSHISSRYGGKIHYNNNGKISINKNSLWYKNEYKNFCKELLQNTVPNNNRIIIKFDVQDFYDSIDVQIFLNELGKKLKYSDKEDFGFNKNKIQEFSDFYKFIMKGKIGIPQSDNDVITSFMGSLFMKLIDLDIISCIQKMNISEISDYRIIQYCDDTYLIIDFKNEKTEKRYSLINQILQTICLDVKEKYNLNFNNKSKIFDNSKPKDIENIKECIKINSQAEIDLQKGEKPQIVFDEIINILEKINSLSISEINENEYLEIFKKIYSDSVKGIFSKEENIDVITNVLDKFDFNKIYVTSKYIVTIVSYNKKSLDKLLTYIETQTENRNRIFFILEYISKIDFNYIKKINLETLQEEYRRILDFKKMNLYTLGYMGLNTTEYNKVDLIKNNENIIYQIKSRNLAESSKNFNIAFNHLVNELKSIVMNKYSPQFEEKNYKAPEVKKDLLKNNFSLNTVIEIGNMFDRRNNNTISHSNGKIVTEKEYIKFKNTVKDLFKEMLKNAIY